MGRVSQFEENKNLQFQKREKLKDRKDRVINF